MSKVQVSLIYALFAFLSAAATQLVQVLIALVANQSSVLDSPTRWGISAGAGIAVAGITAALPYLRAVLPDSPAARASSKTTTHRA